MPEGSSAPSTEIAAVGLEVVEVSAVTPPFVTSIVRSGGVLSAAMRFALLALVSTLAACGAETRSPGAPVAPVIPVAPVATASTAQAPAVAPAPPLTPEENAKALCARLAKETGTEWGAHVDPRSQEMRHLSPMNPVMVGSGSSEQRARAFFERYAAELHATDEELRLVGETASSHAEYVRFEHYLKGTDLPVFLTVSSASFTKEGALYMVQPGFRAGLGALPRRAAVTADAARKSIEAEWSRQCPNAAPAKIEKLALGVRGEPTLPPLLVWQATFSIAYDSNRCQMQQLYIDATTGAVAAAY